MNFSVRGYVYRLSVSQELPISLDQAWAFFSDPKNLEKITPKNLKFDIVNPQDKPMYQGQIIEYKVTPMLNIKTTWISEITHVVPKEFFVDEQRFGPYKFWHHKHFFKAVKNGVLVEDIVDYVLPFGFIGRLFHGILVKPKLRKIFDYRKEVLKETFGEFP